APDGPNRARRSPAATAKAADSRNSRRSSSTSASSTRAPEVGGQRQRQGDNQQEQGEGERGGQPRLLQRRPDLQRYPVRVVGADQHGGLRAQHVVRARLVHLGDDEGQQRVGRGQVAVAEELTDRRVRADHEDQQQAD